MKIDKSFEEILEAFETYCGKFNKCSNCPLSKYKYEVEDCRSLLIYKPEMILKLIFPEEEKEEEEKLSYTETRERIHDILIDFFNYEFELAKNREFDFEFMEYRIDELLRLMRENGGSYKEE